MLGRPYGDTAAWVGFPMASSCGGAWQGDCRNGPEFSHAAQAKGPKKLRKPPWFAHPLLATSVKDVRHQTTQQPLPSGPFQPIHSQPVATFSLLAGGCRLGDFAALSGGGTGAGGGAWLHHLGAHRDGVFGDVFLCSQPLGGALVFCRSCRLAALGLCDSEHGPDAHRSLPSLSAFLEEGGSGDVSFGTRGSGEPGDFFSLLSGPVPSCDPVPVSDGVAGDAQPTAADRGCG